MSESTSSIADDLAQLSISSRKSGRPRFGKSNKLLHRFYEPLILLEILDHTRGPQNYFREPDIVSDDSSNLWRKFMDQLSWICDSISGGTTVSAVATESNPDGPIFWLAANTNPERWVVPHLRWVLQQLVDSHDASPQELDELEERVRVRCIEFSKDKVKTYARLLCKHVREVSEMLVGTSDDLDARLLEDLLELQNLRFSHQQLCSRAYNFRSSVSLQRLSERHHTGAVPSAWSNLRHHIGRLGSWSKASKIFVRVAKEVPQFLYGFKIEYLVPPDPIPAPAADSQTFLHAALRRMFPPQESKRLERVQQMLDDYRLFDVSARFEENYKNPNFQPRVHAELLLLEHFHHRNRQFVNRDRYIGCSKPSCYCCDLYIKCHSGRFAIRASHGNLWKNWRAPIPPMNNDEAAQKHTAEILNKMIKHVRDDVVFQIESKAPPRPKNPDSTTGITTLATDLHLVPAENSSLFNERMVHIRLAATKSLQEYASAQQSSSIPTSLDSSTSKLKVIDSDLLPDEVKTGTEGTTDVSKYSLARGRDLINREPESSDEEVVVFRGRGKRS